MQMSVFADRDDPKHRRRRLTAISGSVERSAPPAIAPEDLVRCFDSRAAIRPEAGRNSLSHVMADARMLRADVERFLRAWPALQAVGGAMPRVDWSQCERQLVDLAAQGDRKRMVPALLAAIRRDAAYKPGEMVMREILCLTGWALEEA
jgi:hypothetical protein